MSDEQVETLGEIRTASGPVPVPADIEAWQLRRDASIGGGFRRVAFLARSRNGEDSATVLVHQFILSEMAGSEEAEARLFAPLRASAERPTTDTATHA